MRFPRMLPIMRAGARRQSAERMRRAMEETERRKRRGERSSLREKLLEGLETGVKARRLLAELKELGSKKIVFSKEEVTALREAARGGKPVPPALRHKLEEKLLKLSHGKKVT